MTRKSITQAVETPAVITAKERMQQRIAQLRAKTVVRKEVADQAPAELKANLAGAHLRDHIITASVGVQYGTTVGMAITKGFFAGLFGR